MTLPLTPAQTVGPYLSIGLDWGERGRYATGPDLAATIRVGGRLLDGQGAAVSDGLIETWQVHPRGFARCLSGPEGEWEVVTTKPEGGPDGAPCAPHLDMLVFARGLLHRAVTRIYFADEAELNATDTVLGRLEEGAQATLLAALTAPGRYRLDIHLSGPHETVFFHV
jgi:protocatechuate 3,4-dioxygenase alpha subunit